MVTSMRGIRAAASVSRSAGYAHSRNFWRQEQRFAHTDTHAQDDARQLQQSVQKQDYDHFACGLLLPVDVRPSYFAIRAMNAELSTIKDTVRGNASTGALRLDWWRQQLQMLYDSPELASNNYLLRGLGRAIHKHNLTHRFFERIIDARLQDLETENVQTLPQLEAYCEKTASSLLYLTLECLDIRDDNADEAAGHAGVATGITTLLRAMPHHSKKEQIYLPEDILRKHNVQAADVLQGAGDADAGEKVAPAVFDVACRALEHVRAARELQQKLPKQAFPAFLPLVPVNRYLSDLETAGFNAFSEDLRKPVHPVKLHYAIVKHYFLGRI